MTSLLPHPDTLAQAWTKAFGATPERGHSSRVVGIDEHRHGKVVRVTIERQTGPAAPVPTAKAIASAWQVPSTRVWLGASTQKPSPAGGVCHEQQILLIDGEMLAEPVPLRPADLTPTQVGRIPIGLQLHDRAPAMWTLWEAGLARSGAVAGWFDAVVPVLNTLILAGQATGLVTPICPDARAYSRGRGRKLVEGVEALVERRERELPRNGQTQLEPSLRRPLIMVVLEDCNKHFDDVADQWAVLLPRMERVAIALVAGGLDLHELQFHHPALQAQLTKHNVAVVGDHGLQSVSLIAPELERPQWELPRLQPDVGHLVGGTPFRRFDLPIRSPWPGGLTLAEAIEKYPPAILDDCERNAFLRKAGRCGGLPR